METDFVFQGPSELQCRILAVLEEAGEEHLSALTNTVIRCQGDTNELIKMKTALRELRHRGFITTAHVCRPVTKDWIVPSSDDSIKTLAEINRILKWSVDEMLWQYHQKSDQLEILATEAGLVMSREILSRFGWRMAERQQ